MSLFGAFAIVFLTVVGALVHPEIDEVEEHSTENNTNHDTHVRKAR